MFLVIVLGNKKDVCYVCVVLVPVCYAPKQSLRTHCANPSHRKEMILKAKWSTYFYLNLKFIVL